MTIYYAIFEATPKPDSPQFENCGGAFINCWVRAQSSNEAESVAAAAISVSGWNMISQEDEWRELTDHSYSELDEEWRWYQQAVTDGECYVYHLWPPEAQDGDGIH
jgi:hypothetical protein